MRQSHSVAARRRAAVVAALAVPLRAEIIEQVLVKVNGDIITKTELEERQIAALRQRMNQDVSPEALKNDEELKKVLAEVTPRILVEAIDELLLVQLGEGARLQAARRAVQGVARPTCARSRTSRTSQKFQAALKQEGMTIDDLRKNVERQFLIAQVQREEVGSKLSITEEEARQYYASHHAGVHRAGDRHAARDPDRDPDRDAEGPGRRQRRRRTTRRASRATAIRARVLAGEDFAKLAAEVSAAPSKANGGLIGPINVSELSEPLQQLLETMKPGEVTQPIRVAKGYQILKLETVKEAAVQPFDERARPRRRARPRATGSVRKCASSSPACAARRSSSGRTTS